MGWCNPRALHALHQRAPTMSTADSSWHATSSNVSSSSAHYYQPTSSMGSNTSSLAKLLLDAPTAAGGLKRRATSPPREASPGPSTRKRVKVEGEAWTQGEASSSSGSTAVDGRRLLGDLTEELECPCCSATVYRPVIVLLCQHFFCGRYVRVAVISWYALNSPLSPAALPYGYR